MKARGSSGIWIFARVYASVAKAFFFFLFPSYSPRKINARYLEVAYTVLYNSPPCFPFLVAGGFLGAWHCVWKHQPCPSHSALWPHAIWALAPWPPAWELEIKIKTQKVNIASTIDIAFAFQAYWDNMASCCGGGGCFLCWAGAGQAGVGGGQGGVGWERDRRTGGHKARKPGFVQPSLKEQTW